MSFIWMFSNFSKGTWAISTTYRMVLLDLINPIVRELTYTCTLVHIQCRIWGNFLTVVAYSDIWVEYLQKTSIFFLYRATWALAIYRQTVEAGARPTVESLSLLLGCLRKPEKSAQTPTFDDRSLAFLGQPRQVTPPPGFDGFGIYDPRALALVEVCTLEAP